MRINIRPVIIEIILLSLVLVLLGRCRELRECHKATSKKSGAMLVTSSFIRCYMGISRRRLHENKTVSFFVSWRLGQVSLSVQDHDGADQANTHHNFVYTVQSLVMAGYRSRHPNKFPRLFPGLRHLRRSSVHCHKNWNHQHWSPVIFDDEFRVSPNHSHLLCFGCNNPLPFQQHDEIFENGNDNSIGWPWTHQQISDGTSEDGSNLVLLCQRAVVLLMIWSYSGASVWMSWAISSCY